MILGWMIYPDWCGDITLFSSRYLMILFNMNFSKHLAKQLVNEIGLYELISFVGLLGLGIMSIFACFHIFGMVPSSMDLLNKSIINVSFHLNFVTFSCTVNMFIVWMFFLFIFKKTLLIVLNCLNFLKLLLFSLSLFLHFSNIFWNTSINEIDKNVLIK